MEGLEGAADSAKKCDRYMGSTIPFWTFNGNMLKGSRSYKGKQGSARAIRRQPSIKVPRRQLSLSSGLSAAAVWDKKEYKFKRTFLISNDGADNFRYGPGSITPGYSPVKLTVQLNEVPNYTDFTSLFDQYKITHAQFKFIPHFNVGQVPLGPQNTQVARICTVIDQDDDTNPTGLATLLQYSSLEESLLDKERVRNFKPRPVVQTYRTSTSTGYMAPDDAVWIDAAQADVPHYCGKALICDTTASADNPRTLTIMCTVWITCKGVH